MFGAQPLTYWKARLDAASLPYGVVQVPEEIVSDPELLANRIVVPIADGGANPRYTVDSPVTIREAPKAAPRVAPSLGEHTDEVLRELGFEAGAIDRLRASGAIPQLRQ
jgi:crotonobetainyl-CoA:carnitine CoA-transferase CaiB-like acyl-CoA transferase